MSELLDYVVRLTGAIAVRLMERHPRLFGWTLGNADTEAIKELLRQECGRVDRFAASDEASFLILSLDSKAL